MVEPVVVREARDIDPGVAGFVERIGIAPEHERLGERRHDVARGAFVVDHGQIVTCE